MDIYRGGRVEVSWTEVEGVSETRRGRAVGRATSIPYPCCNCDSSTFFYIILRRIICFGFIQHEGAYLRDEWNMLDFVIVLFSIFDMTASNPAQGSDGGGGALGALKAVRALRALRPLRAIKKLEGIKQVTTSIFRAIFGCAEVMLITALFYLIFGILAMNFWSGKLKTCNDPSRTCTVPTVLSQPPERVASLEAECPMNLRCQGFYVANFTTQPWNGTTESETTGVWMAREWANPTYDGGYMFACNDPSILTQAACKGLWCVDCDDILCGGERNGGRERGREGGREGGRDCMCVYVCVCVWISW